MGNLYIREEFVNATEGGIFGDTEVYETFTDNRAKLFRSLQKEYGKCVSKAYIDAEEGSRQVGWVFQKILRYEDARSKEDVYLREVWVTLYTAPPTKTTTYHYAEF